MKLTLTGMVTLAECVGTVNVRVSSGAVSWIAFLLQQQAKLINQIKQLTYT